MNKLTPLNPPYSASVATILQQYPKQDGYLLKLFRVFANSTRFLTKGVPNLLDKDSPVSLRHREMIILRVTATNHCEYEWGVHVAIFTNAARLDKQQIKIITEGKICHLAFSEKEQNLLSVVDQLLCSGKLDIDTLTQFRSHFSVAEQLEICALCGTYQTVSYVANIAELESEVFASRFDSVN